LDPSSWHESRGKARELKLKDWAEECNSTDSRMMCRSRHCSDSAGEHPEPAPLAACGRRRPTGDVWSVFGHSGSISQSFTKSIFTQVHDERQHVAARVPAEVKSP